MESYRRLEDLVVYQKLCRLHIEIGKLTHRWPAEDPAFVDFLNPEPRALAGLSSYILNSSSRWLRY